MMRKISFLVVSVLVSVCTASKILTFFPFPSKSHGILGHAVVKHLLNAGHEVTYVTPFPWKNVPPNLEQVDVSSLLIALQGQSFLNISEILEKKDCEINNPSFVFGISLDIAQKSITHENVNKLLLDRSRHFDAVIGEWMYNDIYCGLAQVYECPYIMFTTFDATPIVLNRIDGFYNPAVTPSGLFGHLPPFSFGERVKELYAYIGETLLTRFSFDGREKSAYEMLYTPIMKKLGKSLAPYEEARYNISMALVNTHVSLGYATKIPQNYLPVGGFHVDTDTKPLPKDIQEIMDNAKHGVIYFSMGSNLKSKDLPKSIKDNLLKMFGSLKQTVLWKFEENLPDTPKNVRILQWAPQPSILAHPNCLLFITHGGLLSTTETIYYGVPVIGIPIFADQFMNVDRAVNKGFAKRIDLTYDVADKLKEAIEDVISNPKYTEKTKELSLIYHHRPIQPGQLLVHGVEHAILTKGAKHLRSPQFLTPWYQKLYLDLLALISVILIVLVKVSKIILRTILPDKKIKKKRN